MFQIYKVLFNIIDKNRVKQQSQPKRRCTILSFPVVANVVH